MPQVYLAPGPFGAGGQFFDGNGKPLNGGLINTYGAGGSTPTATYTTSAGTVQNANPVVLNSDGRVPNEIWLIAGTSYKFTVTDSLLNLLGTYDNLTGINDPSQASPNGVLTNVAGTNSITATASPVPSAYAKGQHWYLSPAATNTAAAAINISSVGSRNIMKRASGGIVATVANDLVIGNTYLLSDDGTQLIIEGVRPYSQGADIASATTVNLDTATGDYVHITGTTAITGITLAQGEERTVEFTGALTFTNGASLILPGGTSITTAAGDTAILRGEASGVVRCMSYVPAASSPVGTTNTVTHKGPIDISAAAAGQIKFPSTQNASSNVNTLDDYVEGTWTPAIGGTATYTSQIGTYTKIGRLVTVQMYLVINVIGSGSTSTVTGLPFTSNISGVTQTCGAVFWSGVAGNFVSLTATVAPNATAIVFFGTGAASNTQVAAGVFGNAAAVGCTISYIV